MAKLPDRSEETFLELAEALMWMVVQHGDDVGGLKDCYGDNAVSSDEEAHDLLVELGFAERGPYGPSIRLLWDKLKEAKNGKTS